MYRRIRIKPRFWLFIIVIMLIAFGVSFALAQHSYSEGEQLLAEVTAQRDALVAHVEELNQTFEFAQTDEYVIRIARNELGMIMPNEIRYIAEN